MQIRENPSTLFSETKSRMEIHILNDYKTLCRATANLIVDYLSVKKPMLVCLASGHTPKGVFECLIEDVNEKHLDLGDCTFVSLDEWVGVPSSQFGSCRQMMDDDFFRPLRIPDNQILFFNGLATDLAAETDHMNSVIAAHGGLDIMLVGIGTNGHIAMNEPGTPFDTVAHVGTLAEETKVVGQKYFTDATSLDRGITLGLKHFREAKLPILMANGEKKAPIIAKVLSSTATETLPASIIHLITNGWVMLDQAAATSPGSL